MGKNWLYYVIIAKKHRFWLKVKQKSNHKLKNYKKCPSLVGEACEDKPNLRLYGQTLIIGKPYEIIRVLFIPIFNIIQAYSNIELNYKSDIKGGLLVLHPSAGVVISGLSVIGNNMTLTGGNIIGARPGCKYGEIKIGDNCSLGANAVILGPIELRNGINIGASACVIKDCLIDNLTLIGVPARQNIRS